MLHLLARYWWALALRGVLAVLFGLLAFFIPGITLLSLVLLFGAYVFLDGIFDLVAAARSPSHHWALVLEGIIGIIAGILTFLLGHLYWCARNNRGYSPAPSVNRRNLAHPDGSAFAAFRTFHSHLS
jgi:hypothetical protein